MNELPKNRFQVEGEGLKRGEGTEDSSITKARGGEI